MASVAARLTAPTSPSVAPIPVNNKYFVFLDADGERVHDGAVAPGRGVIRDAGLVAKVTVDLFIEDGDGLRKERSEFSFDLRGAKFSDLRQIRVIDLNTPEEKRVAEGAHVQEVGELTIDVGGGELRVFIPKFEIPGLKCLKSTHLFEDTTFSRYYDMHPEVEGLAEAFVSLCKINGGEIVSDERHRLKKVIVPRLLEARDVLVALFKARGDGHSDELKISGKQTNLVTGEPIDLPSDYLFFPAKQGLPAQYASVKILPNKMISFQIYDYRFKGSYKKVVYKVTSWIDSPLFSIKVKASPRTSKRDSPDELYLAGKEWLFAQALDHPNIVKCRDIFTRQISPTSVVTEVYLDPGKDLRNFFNTDFIRLFDHCESDQDYIDLLDEAMKVMIGIAEGVKCIHDSNILHLDIKPDNILVEIADDDGGKVRLTSKIADFGFAVTRNNPRRDQMMASGTPGYFFVNGVVGSGRDLYAVGQTYEVLANLIRLLLIDKFRSKPVVQEKLTKFHVRLSVVAGKLKKTKEAVLPSGFPLIVHNPQMTLSDVIGYLNDFYKY